MKSIKRICAVVIGFVFFVAGLLKLMDPVGTGLIMREYFVFLHLTALAPAANVAGVFMALLESLLGAALISGVFPVATAVATGMLVAVFTGLTFVMWLLNPSMDCGCFGQAIHLTHFQTFIKNVVLCVLWLVAFIPFSSIPRPRKIKYVSFGIASLSIALFAVWAMVSIPPMDFTPFSPGATLMQADETPYPDAPLLSICNAEGEYCDDLLADGNLLLMTVYDTHVGAGAISERAAGFIQMAGEAGLQPVLIVSGDMEDMPPYYFSDRRTLMTVNRSNGGTTLLRDGMVVAKWSFRHMPSAERLQELLSMDPAEAMQKENTPKRLKLQGFLLYVTAVLLLL